MKFEASRASILTKNFNIDKEKILRHLEECIRTAYKSENKINEDSHYTIINRILAAQHLSTLEHFSISVRVITSISVTREWNRHRFMSITEQSTRYCNYAKDKFGNEITFIFPASSLKWNEAQREHFVQQCSLAERGYLKAIESGLKAEEARALLPLCTKTEAVYTANLREWLHFFELRTANSAHPDIRSLAIDLNRQFADIFNNIIFKNPQ